MSAVLGKAISDLRTRRVETLVLALVILLSSGTGALALNLMSESAQPYGQAFEAQKGAHLLAFFDARLVSPQQVQDTAAAIGAEASAGPWQVQELPIQKGAEKYSLQVIGRADAGGPVANLKVVVGHWLRGPGDIVVTRSFAELNSLFVGNELRVLGQAAPTSLRIVGEAVDVMQGDAQFSGQSAWVTPAQIQDLTAPEGPTQLQMAYRFPDGPSQARVRQAVQHLSSSLPADAVAGTADFYLIQQVFNVSNSVILTFLITFSVFALAACAAIVFNVVNGTVLASYREIGILRAIGFTPLQAAATFVVEMLMIALCAGLVGVPLGLVASQPLIQQSAHALGLAGSVSLSAWPPLGALAGVLLVVVVAAALPARRAARLSPVTAIRIGTGPQSGRGSRLARAAARLPLPVGLTVGIAAILVRPLRAALTTLAILVAVASLTFAYGLNGTLDLFASQWSLQKTVPVTVSRFGTYPDSQAQSLISQQTGTANVVASARTSVTLSGLPNPVNAVAMRGDSGRLGYRLVQGRWFSGPGEVVTQAGLLKDAGLKVGDSVQATLKGRPVSLRIVGVDFEVENFGRLLLLDWSTYEQAANNPQPDTYYVQLTPGTVAQGYVDRLQAKEPDSLSVRLNSSGSFSSLERVRQVVYALTAIIVLIALAGVFNTVLLNTEERRREIGILKAVGMSPRKVIMMVTGSVLSLGLVGGALGLGAGAAPHRTLLRVVGSLLGNEIPPEAFAVFSPAALPLLGLAGIVVAVLGALGPARFAVRQPVAYVLRSE